MQPIKPAVAGQPLRASDLNAQSSELQRLGKTSISNGSISNDATGLHIQIPETKGFYARILSRIGYRYGFAQYKPDTLTTDLNINSYPVFYGGSNSPLGPIKSLGNKDYAEEANLNLNVPYGTVVWLEPVYTFTENNVVGTKYLFNFDQYGGEAITQEVIVDIASDANGLLITKHRFSAYNANTIFSPTLMGCTDVIPKSLSGQKNRVLVVNAAETGFEFGASVAPSTGIATAAAQISGLTSTTTYLQEQISTLRTTVNLLSQKLIDAGL